MKNLEVLPYDAQEQRNEARFRAVKMSIQGVQPKVSARLDIKKGRFQLVDQGGTYILKPQTLDYAHLPENEDLSMKLADALGIETPLHGLLLSVDGSYTYFIKRMDRIGRKTKIPMEDFAQLSGKSRETKYNSSMEQAALVVEKYCSVPAVEKHKLFVLTLFNYLIGNEDAHLKNFSLLTQNGITVLAPAYDLVNTTLALKNAKEEIALPLRGKKSNLDAKDLLIYFPIERLGLNQKIVDQTLSRIRLIIPQWKELIESSFLPEIFKEQYWKLVMKRIGVVKGGLIR